MNKYYCTKCNRESVIASYHVSLVIPCCDKEPTKHRLVSLKGKEDPIIKVMPAEKVISPLAPNMLKETPKVTKLDVASGAVKGKV